MVLINQECHVHMFNAHKRLWLRYNWRPLQDEQKLATGSTLFLCFILLFVCCLFLFYCFLVFFFSFLLLFWLFFVSFLLLFSSSLFVITGICCYCTLVCCAADLPEDFPVELVGQSTMMPWDESDSGGFCQYLFCSISYF